MEAKKKYHQVGVRVSDELLAKISKHAKAEQRSVSQVIKLAVEKYLEPKGHSL